MSKDIVIQIKGQPYGVSLTESVLQESDIYQYSKQIVVKNKFIKGYTEQTIFTLLLKAYYAECFYKEDDGMSIGRTADFIDFIYNDLMQNYKTIEKFIKDNQKEKVDK